jgi:hypothetical protein
VRLRIDWRPTMYVLAVEAVGHLIAMGLPDHTGACGEQMINCPRGARSRRMGLEPQWVAVSGAVIGNVKDILDRHGLTPQRATRRERNVRVTAEYAERIVQDHCGRWSLAGSRDTVMRPRLKA